MTMQSIPKTGIIIPTFIGINSSVTISTLAFLIAEMIVGSSRYLPVESS